MLPVKAKSFLQPTGRFFERFGAQIVVALSCVVTWILHMPLTLLPLGRDQGIWITAGQAVGSGKAFFKDFMHFNLPGSAYAYRVILAFVNDPQTAPAYLSALFSVIMIVGLYLLLSETTSKIAGAWAGALYAVCWPMRMTWWGISQKDFLATPWILLAIWAVARATPDRRFYRLSMFAGGVFTLIAAQFKPIFGGLGILLFAGVAIRAIWAGCDENAELFQTVRRLVKEGLLLLGGAIVGILPLILVQAKNGALSETYYSTFLLGREYLSRHNRSFESLIDRYFHYVHGAKFSLSIPMLTVCYLGVVAWALWFGKRQRFWLVIVFFMSIGGFFGQFKGMGYHLDPWFVTLMMCGGIAGGFGLQKSRLVPFQKISWLYVAIAVVVSLVSIEGMHHALTDTRIAKIEMKAWKKDMPRNRYIKRYFSKKRPATPAPYVTEKLAAWIKKRTRPEDSIVVWGSECQVYVLSGRRFAGQAPFDQCITSVPSSEKGREWISKQQARYVHLLEQDPPKYFVVTTKDTNTVERIPSDRSLRKFTALKAFVDANYSLEKTFERFKIYIHRDQQGETGDQN